MWQTLRLWLTAAALGVGGMLILLLVIGMLTSTPERPAGAEAESLREPANSDDSCSFRIFGSVTNESGDPIETVTISLRGDGPFATLNRNTTTNSSGRFVYLESGYGACVLEDLYPTAIDPTNRYREWSRSEPVTNDEQLRIVLEPQ
ncbi:MAG: carboxypeptidase-like regulatory domain-containing protein [Gammaproteobacteria bacterium]